MIQKNTLVRILDNSGGKMAKCIHVYNNTQGNIGDKILVSMRKIKQKMITLKTKVRVENHIIYKGIIIHNKKGFFRKDNSFLLFNKNSIILLTRNTEKLICTRIYGTLVEELRNKKFMKILTINSISI